MPLLMALVLTAPLALRPPALGRALCAAALAGFALFVPQFSTLSRSNFGAEGVGIRVGWPGLKVPPEPYAWAVRLAASVPPGAPVLAPAFVSAWIPTLHHHPHPLVVRGLYLRALAAQLGEREREDRLAMTDFVAGIERAAGAEQVFRRGLDRYGVKGVCLRDSRLAPAARAALRDAGFARTQREAPWEIWTRH
jgi:hypothetical protein